MNLSKILYLDNSFWIIFKRRRTENDKKSKKESDVIDKVVNYFLKAKFENRVNLS
ncbi:hypothetical protein [Spiroplasma endosymbiont of Agriotes lineatus]|uniref:hypothetical protein n=1 Tax=Spiroplasma endosymbiont of Agriotes lineatus TaxID=3077930 RepID=UPI0030CB2B6E